MAQHLTTEVLRKDFLAVFGQEADQTFFSPGRINLIGEHTDYNGGHVFPAAISLGTYGAARKRDDQVLRFYSANFEDKGIIEVPLADLKFEKEHNWTNYPKGVLHFLQEAGHVIDKGFDFYVYGNIPNGAGLSSSASLELLTGVVAEHLFDLKLERPIWLKSANKQKTTLSESTLVSWTSLLLVWGLINVLFTLIPTP
ncbi:galactokinase, (galactose kinase) [Streptococcus pneumoniae]|nr:galactokinase, (galactose kinase) [Streptococcus pneumoniae]